MDGLFLTKLSNSGAGVVLARSTSVAIPVDVASRATSTNPVLVTIGVTDFSVTVTDTAKLGIIVGLAGTELGAPHTVSIGVGRRDRVNLASANEHPKSRLGTPIWQGRNRSSEDKMRENTTLTIQRLKLSSTQKSLTRIASPH